MQAFSGTWEEHFLACAEDEERNRAYRGSGGCRVYFLGCRAVWGGRLGFGANCGQGSAFCKGCGRNRGSSRDWGLWGHTLVGHTPSLGSKLTMKGPVGDPPVGGGPQKPAVGHAATGVRSERRGCCDAGPDSTAAQRRSFLSRVFPKPGG